MKCSKKRKSGMQVKRYQSGGGWPPGGVDPIERIVKERQAAEYGQLLDYLQRFDQGEIRQAPESAFAGATVLEMMSNPVGAARAAMEQGRRPTKDEIAMAGRKAGPMADVMAISYPAMTAYGLKEGMPGASLVPHSRPFEPSQPMRVVRSIDQGDDAVRSIRKAGYVDYQPASYAIPTNIYREGQDAALDYIAKRQALFKTPEMQRRNAERIADNLTLVANELRSQMQSGNVARNILDDFQRIESSMVGGRVDPNSLLVQQILAEHMTDVDLTQLKVGALAPPQPTGVTREMMAANEAQMEEVNEQLQKLLEEQDKLYPTNPRWQELEQQVNELDSKMARMQRVYDKVPNVSYPADAGYTPAYFGGAEIEMQGKYLMSPRTARVVSGHEFEHGLQEAPYSSQIPSLHGSSQFQKRFPGGLPSHDVLEAEMGQLTPRKVQGPTGINPFNGNPTYRNRQEELYDKAKAYYETGKGRGRERSTYHAEAKQDLVEEGIIPNLDAKVTKQDVLKFYNERYAPEQLRKMGDEPIMDHPQSLRLFEMFDPNVGDNAQKIAEFMNRLSAVAVGTGAAAAASQEYGKGGKYKVKKNKTWKKMRSIS